MYKPNGTYFDPHIKLTHYTFTTDWNNCIRQKHFSLAEKELG